MYAYIKNCINEAAKHAPEQEESNREQTKFGEAIEM
jgi:hypothetical protein